MTTHAEQERLHVTLGGNWRIYTQTLPHGGIAIGIVTRAGYDTGALVLLSATGVYVQVNAGVLRSLPQDAVANAVATMRTGKGGAGRGQGVKAADGATNLRRTNITIDPDSASILREYGDGDLSVGIRRSAARLRSLS